MEYLRSLGPPVYAIMILRDEDVRRSIDLLDGGYNKPSSGHIQQNYNLRNSTHQSWEFPRRTPVRDLSFRPNIADYPIRRRLCWEAQPTNF